MNPFQEESRWNDILQSINKLTGKQFSLRGIKNHTERLVDVFKKEDTANLRKYMEMSKY